MSIIEVRNLSKTYRQKFRKVKALDGMNFEVKEGYICGFLGPNGAGKSTALKVIMGLVKADKGRAFINGISSENAESRRKVGFMLENPPYIDTFTGRELLLFSAKMHGIDKQKALMKVDELLDMFGLIELADEKLRGYSKGMMQKISFAASIIIEPKILILDEPMSGLDPVGRFEFKRIMRNAKKQGVTVFFSSHIIADMEDICDEVIIVNKGKVTKVVDRRTMEISLLEGYKIIVPKSTKMKGYNCELLESGLKSIRINKDELADVITKLKSKNVKIIAIDPVKRNLEELFMEVIGKKNVADSN